MKIGSNKILIVLGLITILLVVTWAVLLYFIQQDRLAVLALKQTISQGGNDSSRLINQDKAEKLKKYFITSSAEVELLELLEQLARQSGVQFSLGQTGEQATELKMGIVVTGSFSRLYKFLQGLENLPYATRIDRIELRKEGISWQGNFALRVLKIKN